MNYPFKTNCPACGSLNQKVIYDFSDTKMKGGVPGIVLSCISCGMLFKNFKIDLNEVYSGEHADLGLQEEFMAGKRARKFFL